MQPTFAGESSTPCLLSESVAINNVMPIIHFEAVKPFCPGHLQAPGMESKREKKVSKLVNTSRATDISLPPCESPEALQGLYSKIESC
jgi:hypothetical protein